MTTTTTNDADTPSEMIVFSDSAAKKVYELISDEGNDALNLRVFISGGGCSGFQYGFTFDEKIGEDDLVVEKAVLAQHETPAEEMATQANQAAGPLDPATVMVKLLVDPLSFQYLRGAEIDYREDINGAQFVIRNPNAKTTCGCGSSFAA